MSYYKIKITSPVEREKKSYIATEEDKELLAKLGITTDADPDWDKEFDDFMFEWEKSHNIYLHYSDKKGFVLARESRGTLFPDEAIERDTQLKEYLQDKQYELLEADPEKNRFMRYRVKE